MGGRTGPARADVKAGGIRARTLRTTLLMIGSGRHYGELARLGALSNRPM